MSNNFNDAALICLNGHVINGNFHASPQVNQSFCDKCGAKTIHQCPGCKAEIRGDYPLPGALVETMGVAPNFCHACGNMYPWLSEKLKAARDLAREIDGLSAEDREILEKSLDDLVRDTPRTEVVSLRFKKIMSKAPKEAYEVMKAILIDVLVEKAKQSVFGPTPK